MTTPDGPVPVAELAPPARHQLDAFMTMGRHAAEELMQDACEVGRVKGYKTDDEGHSIPVIEAVYTGPCRVRPSAKGAVADKTGVVQVETWAYTVSVPLAVTKVNTGDTVKITTSLDPSLTGRSLRVVSIDRGTQITARRLACEEVAR
ncbi:DUF6093 family protein [Streptomyces cellulosae]